MTSPLVPDLPQEIATQVELGRELPGLDYKQSISWHDPAVQAGIVKDCLAMSNLPDGGLVLIGVEETTPGVFAPNGMSQADYDSYLPDDIATEVNLFADPAIGIAMYKGALDQTLFVAIEVAPFDELPTVSRRDGGPPGEQLFAGDVYIRPRGRPETRKVRTSGEMRELVDRAIDLGASRLHRRGWVRAETVQQQFDEELGRFA